MFAKILTTLFVAHIFLLPVSAQGVAIPLEDSQSLNLRIFQLLGAVTLLSIAPSILIMITCFPFIVTVFSILRHAIGLPSTPSNSVIISLSLFTTWFIMEPTISESWNLGVAPYIYESTSIDMAIRDSISPFRRFMESRLDQEILNNLLELSGDYQHPLNSKNQNLHVLIPSFMISEVSRAFQVGFLIFIPFMIIDIVVASVLMAMGMMMVSPVMIALPFKISFFVGIDGWSLIFHSLARSYY